MREEPKTRKRLKNIIGDHIIHHLRRYTIVVLLLFIGIILGVIFVNNLADEQKVEIENFNTKKFCKMVEKLMPKEEKEEIQNKKEMAMFISTGD